MAVAFFIMLILTTLSGIRLIQYINDGNIEGLRGVLIYGSLTFILLLLTILFGILRICGI